MTAEQGVEARAKEQRSVTDRLLQLVVNAINDVDKEAVDKRVSALREQYPDAQAPELADMLIRSKARRTATVGAATSAAGVIPGFGTIAALTLGAALDLAATARLQAELVLEIAAAHGRELSPAERRNAVMLITGLSAGASGIMRRTGEKIANEAAERLVEKTVVKVIPVVGIAASAGFNMLTTRVIGQRAAVYFEQGPEAVGDWAESVRAITGVDERRLASWFSEAAEQSRSAASSGLGKAARAVATAGKATGELALAGADLASDASNGLADWSGEAADKIAARRGTSIIGSAVRTSGEVGARVLSGVFRTGARALEAGRKIAGGSDATPKTRRSQPSGSTQTKWAGRKRERKGK